MRLEVSPSLRLGDLRGAVVRVLPDPPPRAVPREVLGGGTWWGPWVYRQVDAYGMAQRAQRLLKRLIPKAREFQGGPLPLSYWLLAQLPLEESTRQRLLEADCVARRLRMLLDLMTDMAVMRCKYCDMQIGSLQDVLCTTDEGPSGVYVNPHGYVHDMLTLQHVPDDHLRLEGRPDTTNSWFPGYAWTIAYCSLCSSHLGWRFTAVNDQLQPQCFWGLRRDVLGQPPAVQLMEGAHWH